MATAWHTPGIDSPCQLDVGESSAPVAQNRSRRSSRFSSLSSRYPHKTLAPHPQPEPPACTSYDFVSKMRSPQSL